MYKEGRHFLKPRLVCICIWWSCFWMQFCCRKNRN